MSRSGKIAAGLARILDGLAGDSSEPTVLPSQQRFEALSVMRTSIRQLRRETDKRERELDDRWQRVLELKRRGRDQLAFEEIRTFRHEQTMLAKLFAVLGGQERVYSTARALGSINAFKEAVSTFMRVSALAESPNVSVEAEVDELMSRFEESVAQFDDAQTEPIRVSATRDPELERLWEQASREASSEDTQYTAADIGDEVATDESDEEFDDELERRLEAISRDRRRLQESRSDR